MEYHWKSVLTIKNKEQVTKTFISQNIHILPAKIKYDELVSLKYRMNEMPNNKNFQKLESFKCWMTEILSYKIFQFTKLLQQKWSRY